jgi:CubicO group peptidase (beta-lactamase class C family)
MFPGDAVHGSTAPGFEGVRTEFENNLALRGELGAAFAVHHRGQLVVDLWGGHLDRRRTRPWQRDTVTTVFSTTKGISALALALAHSRQLLDWDAPVARYWPEFAQAGKQDVTVRQLCAHQAGLSGIDERLDAEILADLDRLAEILARQKPAWKPGTRHGYHAISLGWFQGELLRRVDPEHRSLGRFFRDELAAPLGLDFHIGLPADFEESRIASIHPMSFLRAFLDLGAPNVLPRKMLINMPNPRSLTGRAFANPRVRHPTDFNRSPEMRAVEIPSVNGIGDARSIARLYGAFATGGSELELRKETLDTLMADPVLPSGGTHDLVLRTDTVFSLGFMKPSRFYDFASSPRAFGTPGAGGSFGFADPDARLGMGYVMNRMGIHLVDDPREKALRDAAYRALARFGPGV